MGVSRYFGSLLNALGGLPREKRIVGVEQDAEAFLLFGAGRNQRADQPLQLRWITAIIDVGEKARIRRQRSGPI